MSQTFQTIGPYVIAIERRDLSVCLSFYWATVLLEDGRKPPYHTVVGFCKFDGLLCKPWDCMLCKDRNQTKLLNE